MPLTSATLNTLVNQKPIPSTVEGVTIKPKPTANENKVPVNSPLSSALLAGQIVSYLQASTGPNDTAQLISRLPPSLLPQVISYLQSCTGVVDATRFQLFSPPLANQQPPLSSLNSLTNAQTPPSLSSGVALQTNTQTPPLLSSGVALQTNTQTPPLLSSGVALQTNAQTPPSLSSGVALQTNAQTPPLLSSGVTLQTNPSRNPLSELNRLTTKATAPKSIARSPLAVLQENNPSRQERKMAEIRESFNADKESPPKRARLSTNTPNLLCTESWELL